MFNTMSRIRQEENKNFILKGGKENTLWPSSGSLSGKADDSEFIALLEFLILVQGNR